MEINFDGKIGSVIFGITEQRSNALSEELSNIAGEILENFDDYTFYSEQIKGPATHTGMILQRLLRDYTDEGERMFILFITNGLIDLMHAHRARAAFPNIFSQL